MAETMSVKAVLSAVDKNFTSTMKAALGSTDSLGSKLKSGIGFGAMMAIGNKAISSIGSGITGLISDINTTNAAWKNFSNNMHMNGHTEKEIKSVKKELQDFAAKTIYTSADMASTFSQLDAVGTKGTAKLVKGFGAVAAAAENPSQAMKTLSTQATQMAAKPMVAWQDFKLMLEQSPAGIAQVAKKMGMSTKELVANVQNGTVKTEEFFEAIRKCGEDETLMKMAQSYKTIGEAADGLKATLANRLAPAFDVLSKTGIKAISGLMTAFASIDGAKIAANIESFVAKCGKYWEALKDSFRGVGSAFKSAFGEIGEALGELNSSFGKTESIKTFKSVMSGLASVLKSFAGFCKDHAEAIARLIDLLPKLLMGYLAFKAVSAVAGPIMTFAGGIKSIIDNARGAKGITDTAEGITKAGSASMEGRSAVDGMAKAFLALGAGVLMASGGFYLLATAAVKLAESGPAAVAVTFGLIAAMAGLAYGASIIGENLAKATPGLLGFGAAVLLCGAGIWLIAQGMNTFANAAATMAGAGSGAIACMLVMTGVVVVLVGIFAALGSAAVVAGVSMLLFGAGIALVGLGAYLAASALATIAGVLPTVCQYGITGAASIAALGASMFILAGGAIAGGISCGLAAIGFGALALAMAGLALATKSVNTSMKSIATSAVTAASSLTIMVGTIGIVKSGLSAIGSMASSAMNKLKSAFSNAASSAQASGTAVGSNFCSGMTSGLSKATSAASKTVSSINTAFMAGAATAYISGVQIGIGLGNGIYSQLGFVRAAAAALAREADKAIQAKAKIHSPSRVTRKDGVYTGEGYGLGILDRVKFVRNAAGKLFNSIQSAGPDFAYAGSMSATLSDEYDYSQTAQYNITVVSELDGREIAKATAEPMEEELSKRQKRTERKAGRR